jgi:predicted TIM-barrel enzyme
MDVVTTSGPGTGIAAARAKIVAMKEAVGGFPLAIASGITPDNVADYLDVADCFLVATGISRSFTELDPEKTRTLIERVDAHAGC